jgi:MinD-like ATPase involved in chromosome partitioning or flagellar assembly
MEHEIQTKAELCLQLFSGKSWAVLRATEDARDGEIINPYAKGTENYDLWMEVRFGKASVQEAVLKVIPNNLEYRAMVESQKPKCKRPQRSETARHAARLFMKGLK